MKRILTLFVSLFFISWIGMAQTVASVTTTSAAGPHKIGDIITIRVTFSAAVDVAGTPRIQLNITPSTQYATTVAINNVTQVDFTYTVQTADVSARLDYASTSSLTLNGGTIFAQGTSTPATLTLPATASSGLYTTNLIIDGVAPTGYSVIIDQAFINNSNKAAVSFTFTSAEIGTNYGYSIDDTNGTTAAVTGTGTITAANQQITGINTTPLDDGTLTLTVFLIDAAGNQGPILTDTKTKDASAPTVIITRTPVTLGSFAATTDNTISYAIVFNKAINSSTFTTADIVVSHGGTTASSGNTLTNPSADNKTFVYTLTAITGDGTITITVGPSIDDNGGNSMAAAQGPSAGFTIDNTAPGQPATPDLITGSDSGSSNSDNITNTLSPQFSVGATESGATVQIFSTVDAGIRGSAVASGTTTTVNTTLITQGNTQTHSITAVQTDAAGNPGTTSSGLTITLDATAPTVTAAAFFSSFSYLSDASFTTCNGIPVSNDSNREFVHLTLSEALGVANGTSMPIGSPGFASSTGALDACTDRGGTSYHGTNTIHLKSNNDGAWTSATTYSFTPGSTVVKDIAGNEMGTFTGLLPGDLDPPGLATGLVFFPNGSGPETIVFKLNQPLNPAVTTTVTGFTTSTGTIVAGANYNSATNTVTLTSSANGQWTDAVTLAYNQATGNVTDPANNELVAFPTEPILLTSVHIQSNNANTGSATTGNTITLTFTTSRTLASVPVVTIGGLSATVTGGPASYTASVITTAVVPETTVTFQIDAAEAIKTTTVTATTDNSSVTFDKTGPAYTAVTIASNGTNTAFAKPGNNVVLTFTLSETSGALPTATIDGKTATVVNTSGLNYTATVTTDNTYNNGTLAFSISAVDATGNTGTGTTITSGSQVTFDKTPPIVASIVASSTTKGFGNSQGIAATSVDFLITFTESSTTLTGIETNGADFTVLKDATVNYTSLAVTGTGSTRTVTVNGISGLGRISLGLADDDTILDAAANPLGGVGAGNGSVAASYTGTQYYTIVLPEPANGVVSLTAPTVTSSSITVQWNQPAAGAQAATHYLVMGKPSSGSYSPLIPADGTYVADAPLIQNIVKGAGLQTATFNVSSGTSYDFIIYPYTWSANYNDVNHDNIDFKTPSTAFVNGVVTSSASVSALLLNSTPVSIGSIKNASGNSKAVMKFTIYDDGLDPISPNVMSLQLNGASQETITFTLRDQLTLTEGASVTGFTSSTGSVANAIYSGKGTTNTITLTNTTNGTWNSATTINYSGSGNAQFSILGKMQAIDAHAVVVGTDVVQTFTTNGSFTVPAGVTKIQVEAWGAGGSGGGYSQSAPYNNASSYGGGGGAYSRSLVTVTPGNSYSYTVGSGGTPVVSTINCCDFGVNGGSSTFGGSLVTAQGGFGALSSAYPTLGYGFLTGTFNQGGQATNGTGDVKFSGGNGGFGSDISPNPGGGGGSSAGTVANGNQGTHSYASPTTCPGCGISGGAAPAGGGTGGAGFQSTNGGDGFIPGGGGGGVGSTFSSGAGANGQIRITYSSPSLTGTSDWDADNSPFKFSQLIITQGTGNDLIDWRDIIAGAELTDADSTHIITGTVNPANGSSIIFSSIPSTLSTDLGYVPDAISSTSPKTYTLKIWIKNNLNTTLASAIDGLNLAFKVDPTIAANLTYDDVTNSNQKSSRLVAATPAIESGANTIDVVASKLVYNTPGTSPINTNPQSQIGVGVPFSANGAGQDPEVYAVDVNNNIDLNYNNSANLTNPLQTFGQSLASGNFSSGKLLLNPFYFSTGSATLANTRIVVTGTGSPVVTAATSTDIWPRISNLTTISTAAGAEPATISSLVNTLAGASANFDFTITDDLGANSSTFADNDALPTLINQITISQGSGNDGVVGDWTKAIAGAELTLTRRNGIAVGPTSVNSSAADIVIGATSISFSNIPFALATSPGRISDGGANVYTLKIYLKSTIDPSITDLIDGKDFVFEASNTNTIIGGASNTSSVLATSTISSGDGLNTVAVVATKLDFITQWTAGATQSYDTPLDANAVTAGVQSPAAKARDLNGNLDLSFNAAVSAVTSAPATYPLASSTITVNNGLLTFDPALKVTSAGGGTNGGTTNLIISSTGLTNGTSNSFTLNYSPNSDVVVDAGFTHPQNILYANANNQVTDITSGTAVAMEQFTVRDGGGSADADGTATKVSSVVLNINNYQLLRRVALYDGSTEIADLIVGAPNITINSATNADITFSGLTFVVPDDDFTTRKLTIKASFVSTAIAGFDNSIIEFKVKSIVAAAISSSFIVGASTAFPTLGTNENKIEVLATELDFTTPSSSTSASLNSNFAVALKARDAFTNVDLDFNGTITSVTNATGATMQGNAIIIGNSGSGIQFGTTTFTAGSFTFPASFQFTSGNNNDAVTLSITAGGISSVPVSPGPAPYTPIITLTSSFESVLKVDPAFSPAINMNYELYQDISTSSTSIALAQFKLFDGDGVTPDLDGAGTNINDIEFSVTNPANIRSLGIYVGTTLIQSKDNSQFVPGSPTTITFTGLTGSLVAPDNGSVIFTVRASFFNTATEIHDNDNITLRTLSITQNGGSKFKIIGTPPLIGGITNGDQPVLRRIEVTATSLDFVTQASPYAGINEPIGASYTTTPLFSTSAAIVHARDVNAVIDLDFTYPALVTGSTANAASSKSFIAGILDLDGMEYSSTGDGTLKVVANSIDSSLPAIGNHTPGQLVNVIHTTATLPGIGSEVIQPTAGSSPPSYSIKGGSLGQTIFGVTFTAQGATGLSEPSLRRFSFKFDVPYTSSARTIFSNFVVKEESVDITSPTIAGSLTFLSSTNDDRMDSIVVNLSTNERLLYNAPGQTLTYYLVADVDASASISTPAITPMFTDGGYLSPTDKNIFVSKGTASGTFTGNKYTFASTKPPVLKTAKGTATNPSLTSPYAGQLNVDPAIQYITLEFDTKISTLDGGENNGAELYLRKDNTKVADLIAPLTAGNYLSTGNERNVITPLRYNIKYKPGFTALTPDEVYYVIIKKGSFDQLITPTHPVKTGTGIADEGLNFFGGISSNSTLYFKASSNKPILLSNIKSTLYNSNVGSINTTFDQFGTAYYLIVHTGSPAPTSFTQIKNPATYLASIKYASGSYAINQINTLQTNTFASSTNFVAGQSYDVYVYAENDANPTPFSAGGIFGSDKKVTGTGPTIQVSLPGTPPAFQPVYLICPNSYVTVTDPIILEESTINKFSSGAIVPGNAQDFNILLPTGYEFDGVTVPDVQLIGADFNGSFPTITFISNSVLKVSYKNFGSASKDYIVISNMKVKGLSGSPAQSIQRFYGNNTSFASQTAVVATIGLSTGQTSTFTNSYSAGNSDAVAYPPSGLFPSESPDVVTAIPDNYIDFDKNISGSIRLIPKISVANDYNASIFTGTGVTNDLLTLSAVNKDAAFNITMNHTDPNGCFSQVSVQYLVYDHTSPITKKLGTSSSTVNPAGTAQALVNSNFPASSGPILPADALQHNELAGYELKSLTADLPASVLNNPTSQIISGPEWRTQVQNLPVQPPESVLVPPFGTYYNYKWDYSKILNAPIGGSIEKNPYYGNLANKFDALTGSGNTYYKGGSLGRVQFTGLFQSMADLQVLIPFRQEVELFVPALPIIEIGSSNQSFTDTSDGTLNTLDSKTPQQHINDFQYANGYEGTPIFCEAGGAVTLNGFPAALAGTSTGTFALYDYVSFNFNSASNTKLISSSPNSDFVDNGNGSTTINPQNASIKNGYKDILVAYTYQENNSPAVATGYLIIRVAPNPLANFQVSSVTGPNVPSSSIYCENKAIDFNASASSITNGSIKYYVWNFSDQTNSTGTNPNIDSVMVSKHTFIQPAAYTISLTTTSDVGCVSTPKTSPLKVGSIPTVVFGFRGVSVDEGIAFKNTSTIPSSSISGLGDGFYKVEWNYGDGTPIDSVKSAPFIDTDIIHKYATAGLNHVNVKVSSLLGCVNTLTKDIIVLANEKPTPTKSYVETFESSNGKWQPSALPITSVSTNPASWLIGAPSNAVIKIDPSINDGKFVKTGAVSYNPSERSAFYSPVFDLSLLSRPMVSFNSFIQLETSDGVVLEYSTDSANAADPNKKWKTLGQPGEGVQWFTDRGVAAKPGNQTGNDYGWSKSDNTKWGESKHIIDPAAKATRVVFRFALASVKTPAVDGFAFDNFRVGERTRTILMENFTTTNGKDAIQNSTIAAENDFINTKFIADGLGTTIVKLNYHIGFASPNPFNIDNPADPSARALYYNVKDVPYAVLDGARPAGATNLSSWGNAAYDAQTLQLGQAEITIPAFSVNTDGSIKFDVEVTAKNDLPENTILHVAVIEQAILQSALSTQQKAQIKTNENSFTYVLKQMLPNALGTKLGGSLLKEKTKLFQDFEYFPDPLRLYANADDLAIIVFLQNEDTKEIYQTYYKTEIKDPPTITGLEEGLRIEDITLYPNPADQEINILMPRKAIGDVEIQLFNQMGKSVANSTIKTSEQKGTLNVRDLPASMYLMRLAENGVITMKKVVVVHQN